MEGLSIINNYLWNVNTWPEEFEVFPQFSRLVFRVENGQLGEHAHMGSLQTQRGLEQTHQLLEVASLLIVVVEVFKFISMYNDVKAAHLGQAELVVVHAGEADLFPGASAANEKLSTSVIYC